MWKRQDISNGLRLTNVAVHWTGKAYQNISEQFGVQCSTVRKKIVKKV